MNSALFPLVTIGLPVFNGAATLAAALETLVRQDYPNLQIIISDNASTDGTLAICEEFAARDSRIHIIRKLSNEGPVENFRTVLNAAKSEYFMWAAADDYWHPQFISRLLPLLRSDPRIGVAMCAVERCYPDGSHFDMIRFSGSRNPNGMGHLKLVNIIMSGAKFNLFIYGLFRTNLLQRAMQQFPDVLGGDRQFICQIALACRFAYVDEVLHTRTHHPNHEDDYRAILGNKGTLRRQLLSFANMLLNSRVIPWWRKGMIPWILIQYLHFSFKQKLAQLLRKQPSKFGFHYMKKIARKFYLSSVAMLSVIVALGLVLITAWLLVDAQVISADLSATIAWITVLWITSSLLIRRWVIRSQKTQQTLQQTLQQALADNRQEHNKSYDHLMRELRYLTVGDVSNIREKIQMLQPEDILNLSSFLTLKVKLDYDKDDIFLQISSLTEYPRRLACHKEPMTVRWIEQHINEGDVFYDIGSNVGAYGLLAAKVKKATVIAFEPAFFNYVSACRNVLINGCNDKISVFPFAISSKSQADYFNYADLNAGSANHSLGEPINYRGEHFVAMCRQPVIAYSLDDLISQFDFPMPSHIKIDVDGTEMNVLMGAQRTLENPLLRTIMIEISERRAPASAITAYLNPKGWRLAERYDRPVKPGQSDVSYLLFVR